VFVAACSACLLNLIHNLPNYHSSPRRRFDNRLEQWTARPGCHLEYVLLLLLLLLLLLIALGTEAAVDKNPRMVLIVEVEVLSKSLGWDCMLVADPAT